jgi:hypothetical protein
MKWSTVDQISIIFASEAKKSFEKNYEKYDFDVYTINHFQSSDFLIRQHQLIVITNNVIGRMLPSKQSIAIQLV